MLDCLQTVREDRTITALTPTGKTCYTYLVEVPYSHTYVETFKRVRGLLESQGVLTYNLAEMIELRMVTSDYMITSVKRAWTTSGLIRSPEAWAKIESVSKSWRSH